MVMMIDPPAQQRPTSDTPANACPDMETARALIASAGIGDDDMAIIVGVLYRKVTQQTLADELGVSHRQRISERVRAVAAKLIAQGLPIRLPGKGRRPLVRPAATDPEAMGRLTTERDDGLTSGRWVDGKKESGSNDNDQRDSRPTRRRG